jgi:RNA polymerase sigma-70 factor (ECF subfamily)
MVSDLELINRFSEGDTDAFERLIIRYEKKIYSICFYFAKDQTAAENAALDIIMKLYSSLIRIRKEEVFVSRMSYLISSTCLNYFDR